MVHIVSDKKNETVGSVLLTGLQIVNNFCFIHYDMSLAVGEYNNVGQPTGLGLSEMDLPF